MNASPILALGLLSLALAAPASGASKGPEYRPLAGASQLKRGESLKPRPRNIELPPVVLESRVHFHEDGSVSHECTQHHGDAKADTTKPEVQR